MSFSILMLVVTHILLPLIFISMVWKTRFDSRLGWLLCAVTAVAYIAYIYVVGRWDWFSYYLRYVLVALLAFAIIRSYGRGSPMPFLKRAGLRGWMVYSTYLFMFFVFALFTGIGIKGYAHVGQAAELSFPMRNGVYYIAHGGSSRLINPHNVVAPQRYALDIVKLGAFGSRAGGILPKELTKYHIFGEMLYSPADGYVVSAVDGLPDLTPPQMDATNLAGNHVVIKHSDEDLYIFLAHLKQGSVLVAEGQSVTEGQPIGRVGNSGHTSEPHLHIHCVRNPGSDLLRSGEGVPVTFDGKFFRRNALVRK